jgi:hypothetical protein
LQHHIDVNNILAQQCGFRTKFTDMATFTLINNILLARNNKFAEGGLFCDLTKAFNCVNHEVLLAKLEFYGNNVAGKLIKSYLTDGYQRTLIMVTILKVYMNGRMSSRCTTNFSTWAIFLLYINDLPFLGNKSSKSILYVDDTSVLFSNTNFTELVTTLKAILLTSAYLKKEADPVSVTLCSIAS